MSPLVDSGEEQAACFSPCAAKFFCLKFFCYVEQPSSCDTLLSEPGVTPRNVPPPTTAGVYRGENEKQIKHIVAFLITHTPLSQIGEDNGLNRDEATLPNEP